MLSCFLALRAQLPGSRLLIANRGEHDMIARRSAARGIEPEELELLSVPHGQMPCVIGRVTAGMALIKPAYSKIASAPTKLAEYLGCGVPCLGNVGVGDIEEVLEDRRVGVALPGFSDSEIEAGVHKLIALTRQPDIQLRCRSAATDIFSLPGGAAEYGRIYRELAAA
jgi:hypothetical protein